MKGFATSDARLDKAKKIEAVLNDALLVREIRDLSILDVGCGSGIIAAYFASNNKVCGVDVENQIAEGYRHLFEFKISKSAMIPCADRSFDVVISNHVVEHMPDQGIHLSEISRVLRAGGVCYFATPNWSFPIEPHYKIPLIHYLPGGLFHGVLKILGRYREELYLLSHGEMLSLLRKNRFVVKEYTTIVLKNPERYFLGMRFTKYLPASVLQLFARISPTNLFIIKK
jgi:2-polyprenyl-3-methyl-5-hydroxy-6-metoxy-1,4-benzoquinol methylase